MLLKSEAILAIAIFLILSLAGCNIWGIINIAADIAKILLIGKNIGKALEEKDVSLFMQNISYYYSDTDGHTFYTVDGLAKVNKKFFSKKKRVLLRCCSIII